jgi:hypothetical protein
MLLVLNLPLIGLWVHLMRTPYALLFPLILVFCIVGVYASSTASFDVTDVRRAADLARVPRTRRRDSRDDRGAGPRPAPASGRAGEGLIALLLHREHVPVTFPRAEC